ncbi:hypothetical protein V6N13_065854 [Hibiscus sabdariffa]|uniref:Uncharacterized protein n=1 Tax=Hibiscus sabdariffa TaxID=183260 RepID=A0ABR2BHW3_9ROSI
MNLIIDGPQNDIGGSSCEADLPPHFRVMMESFDMRLTIMQSHLDRRLTEIETQQLAMQTQLREIRSDLNARFKRLVVDVAARSQDLSSSPPPPKH